MKLDKEIIVWEKNNKLCNYNNDYIIIPPSYVRITPLNNSESKTLVNLIKKHSDLVFVLMKGTVGNYSVVSSIFSTKQSIKEARRSLKSINQAQNKKTKIEREQFWEYIYTHLRQLYPSIPKKDSRKITNKILSIQLKRSKKTLPPSNQIRAIVQDYVDKFYEDSDLESSWQKQIIVRRRSGVTTYKNV